MPASFIVSHLRICRKNLKIIWPGDSLQLNGVKEVWCNILYRINKIVHIGDIQPQAVKRRRFAIFADIFVNDIVGVVTKEIVVRHICQTGHFIKTLRCQFCNLIHLLIILFYAGLLKLFGIVGVSELVASPDGK